MSEGSEWVRTVDSRSLKSGDMVDFDAPDGRQILIARIGDRIFATDRICTHAYADLSTGFMNEQEGTVTCPLHLSAFKLENGVPQNLPAKEPLRTYKVKIQDNSIYILL